MHKKSDNPLYWITAFLCIMYYVLLIVVMAIGRENFYINFVFVYTIYQTMLFR